jgi:hypothetical protein
MKLEYLFYVIAVALAGAAAFLLWQQNTEWAFAAGVLSACAYFIGLRFKLKPVVERRKAEIARMHEDKYSEEDAE